MADNNILNNIAIQKPSTLNPVINLSARRIISVFMTNKKSPKVTTVIGSVRTTRMGCKNAYKNPKTRATRIAIV